jgi:enoyl-CoA hydratase/3-hydroxyacyl-CoA dehydrogenase
MDSKTAADLGLVTNLVDISEVESTIQTLDSDGKPENKYPGKPANPDSKVAKFANSFYSDENIATVLAGNCPEGFDSEDKGVSRQMKSLSRTAPIALSLANDLINAAGNTNLSDGLGQELGNLETIFSTDDALEGLSALIEGRRPTYQNS